MVSIEHEKSYTMKLTSREYAMLLDSLVYAINSISSVQTVNAEYIDLRDQMIEGQA